MFSDTGTRRDFLALTAGLAAGGILSAHGQTPVPAARRKPNFVVIFTDDQGYADVGCFGAREITTPRLDRMAAEGMIFTDFYVGAPVCTPSRASLLTGCYAARIGMAGIPKEDKDWAPVGLVLFPNSLFGLHPDEVTIADLLKSQGYATACIGKWHLGDAPEFLPTRHGFDYYYGIPYSHDMTPRVLMRGDDVIEDHVEPATLTQRYTEEAVRFIEGHKDEPFFLYLPHNMPHVPLHVSDHFKGTSGAGLYGDVVAELDWSVGEILDTLSRLGIDEDTLVVFTSDNGPWLHMGPNGGSATPLRSGKGMTYEGGMREPCIMRWPGCIPAGEVCGEIATVMDLLPTFAELAGAEVPKDRVIDGKDISPLLTSGSGATTPHEAIFYYFSNELHAVRSGRWKLRLENTLKHEDIFIAWPNPQATIPEALYNLDNDPGEQKNLITFHPEIAERLRRLIEKARADIGDSRTGVVGANTRPIGKVRDHG